jgi:hypothetical protein
VSAPVKQKQTRLIEGTTNKARVRVAPQRLTLLILAYYPRQVMSLRGAHRELKVKVRGPPPILMYITKRAELLPRAHALSHAPQAHRGRAQVTIEAPKRTPLPSQRDLMLRYKTVPVITGLTEYPLSVDQTVSPRVNRSFCGRTEVKAHMNEARRGALRPKERCLIHLRASLMISPNGVESTQTLSLIIRSLAQV